MPEVTREEFEAQQAQINDLKSENDELRDRVAELERQDDQDDQIKELQQRLSEKGDRIAKLERQNDDKDDQIEELQEQVDELEQQDDKDGHNDELQEQVDELKQQNDEQGERIEELEQETEELRSDNDRLKTLLHTQIEKRKEAEKRVDELEARLETRLGDTEIPEQGTPTVHDTVQPETPLEDIVQLPEHVADDTLPPNEKRARFIAKGIHEYSRKVPAGRGIKSSEIRRVLAAADVGNSHTQTTSRVIEYLDDHGKEQVEVAETQSGERIVVFDDDLVQRLVKIQEEDHTVVSDHEVSA